MIRPRSDGGSSLTTSFTCSVVTFPQFSTMPGTCPIPTTATTLPPPATPKKGRHLKVAVDLEQQTKAASSPICSKIRSPKKSKSAKPADLFSPGPWRKGAKPYGAASKPERPLGDPLGVMYTLLEDDAEVLYYMLDLPQRVPTRFLKRMPILKPKRSSMPKNTLVLDLDETLVHCNTEGVGTFDERFSVRYNSQDYDVYMKKRPYLEEFLAAVSKWFEVVVFTASQKCYANTLLDVIDKDRKYIHHRVFRESCAHYKDNFLKPLQILNRSLSNCFLIDNSPQTFGFQIDNGIPITSWFDNEKDDELKRLVGILQQMKDLGDVRPFIRQTFRVREFLEHIY